MGSSAILIGAIALGTALVCLFAGYRWGRSNVRSQVEDALDMARVSADSREFALREQLDQKMLELGELRARAEEVKVLQEQLAQSRSSQLYNSPRANPLSHIPEPEQNLPVHLHETESVAAVAENPIQTFFHPKELKPQPFSPNHDVPIEAKRSPAARFPTSFPSAFGAPTPPPDTMKPQPVQPATPAPAQPAKLPAVQTSKPVAVQPEKPRAVKPVPAVNNDDWDEFAKSLEALKNLQK